MAAKGTCKYCGEQSGNLSVHEPKCEKNPVNIKQETLVIKDVTEFHDSILSAYFQVGDKQYVERIPEFHGSIKFGDEVIPMVFITANDGRILPPFMIEGFVGMFVPDVINEKGMPEKEVLKEPEPPNPAIEAIRNYAKSPAKVKPEVEVQEVDSSGV